MFDFYLLSNPNAYLIYNNTINAYTYIFENKPMPAVDKVKCVGFMPRRTRLNEQIEIKLRSSNFDLCLRYLNKLIF